MVEKYVQFGKWAWLFGVIAGIITIFWAIIILSLIGSAGLWGYSEESEAQLIWYIIASIILIIFSFYIKGRFCNKIAAKDYEGIYNDTITIGGYKIPWILIFGVFLEILGNWWGGLFLFVPAVLLIFMGPRKYDWKA